MIIAIGSIALDTTRTPFKTVKNVLGGSATYFGLASSFFSRTGIVGVVGNDFPKKYYELLKERLDISGLKIIEGKTFRFDSSFDYDLGKRVTNKTDLNVFEKFDPILPKEYRRAEYVYLGNIDPEQQLKILEQVNKPRLTVSDTIELWISTKRRKLIEIISRVDCMVLNDDEVRQLCKTPNIINGAETILDWGTKFVVVKKGEHGAILFSHDGIFPTPGFPMGNVVDPTGAGDSFAGGFLGHITRKGKLDENTIKEAIVYGNVMGSFAVEDFSVNRLLSLKVEDIEERYQKYRNIVKF